VPAKISVEVKMVSKKIVLYFSPKISNQPIVYRLVRDYNLELNILRASIDYKKEGMLILELTGEEKNYNEGIKYLENIGIKMQSLSQYIIRNEKECIDCGVCIPICPADALEIASITRKVNFNNEKCIACKMCIKACPQRAMEVYF